MVDVIIGRPALDWLTIGSFHAPDYMVWKMWLDDYAASRVNEPKIAGRMQYRGHAVAQAFLGTATQDHVVHGKKLRSEHALLQLSGASADNRYHELLDLSSPRTNASRIDIQVTIPLPDVWMPQMCLMSLRTRSWGRGRPPQVRLVEGGDGLDTVYIGSRGSDRIIRIYVKEVNAERFLRFEVEYKGSYAREVWKGLGKGKGKASYLMAELRRIPLQMALKLAFERVCKTDEGVNVRVVRKDTDTLNWLAGLVSDVVKRMMADHDEGHDVRELVKAWYEMAQDIESRLS